MDKLDQLKVAERMFELNEQAKGLGILHGAGSNFLFSRNGVKGEADQKLLAQMMAIAPEVEHMIADVQVQVDMLLALSEQVKKQNCGE